MIGKEVGGLEVREKTYGERERTEFGKEGRGEPLEDK